MTGVSDLADAGSALPPLSMAARGSVLGVYFSLGQQPDHSPKFDCATALIARLGSTRKTAHVAIYGLTHTGIVDALIAAHQRGVEVLIVLDKVQSSGKAQAAQLARLLKAGVPAKVATRQTHLQHNKVLIADGRYVLTGSFNWTVGASGKGNAASNDENLVEIEGTEVAADFEQYVFQRIWTTETTQKLTWPL